MPPSNGPSNGSHRPLASVKDGILDATLRSKVNNSKPVGKGTEGVGFGYDGRTVTHRLVELTARDRDILETLAQRVRVFTLAQLGRTWWADSAEPQTNARRRMKALAAAGLVDLVPLTAHPEVELLEPLATWQLGLPVPDFESLSRVLSKRFGEPERTVDCVFATTEAAAVVGGSAGRAMRDSEATHDIHLSAVYLRMRAELPTRARSWQGEWGLPKGHGVKVPDAMVRDGKFDTAIEFGGSYSAEKLAEFHAFCAKRRLGYELW